MIKLGTIRECFRYNDWARERLLGLASDLTDAQLDRPFEMGEGSLRATIYHLWAAEFCWLDRWQPQKKGTGSASDQPEQTQDASTRGACPLFPRYDAECHGESIAEIGRRFRETAAAREAFIAQLDDPGLVKTITYTNSKGVENTYSFGDMLLHVCNHGTHHRAQAINMLRQLTGEIPKPGIDYIFWRMHEPADPPSALDVGTLQAYYAYADWARDQVHTAAAKLTDEQLDRPFEMGPGTLRATLVHMRDAEQWWWQNWTQGPGQAFPAIDARLSLSALARDCEQVAAQRNDLLSRTSDADLLRPVTVMPRPGVTRTFLLGVTMLQICQHGTHHRAQALNMLRHVGGDVPVLDYAAMLRQLAARAGK